MPEPYWEREAPEARLRAEDRVGPWMVGYDPGGTFVEESIVLMRQHGRHHEVRLVPVERACRECGCTELAACDPPCHWVEPDLCSACRRE